MNLIETRLNGHNLIIMGNKGAKGCSDEVRVRYEVPQGSILGPL